MVTWTEPSLREVAYRAAWSQMRSDRRRQQEAAERREFRREIKIELLAALAAFGTVAALVGLRLWVMGW